MRYVWCVFRNRGVTGISEGKIWFLSPYWITVFTYENRTGVFDGILYSEIPHQRQGCFLKRSRAFKKRTGAFSKTTGCFDVFPLVLYNMAKHLVSLSEVSVSPQTSCSSAFRLKDMHDKILQPKKIFQRDRVSDVVLFGFLSVFGFTFIHLLTTAERKNYAVEGSQCINLSAGMPMNRTFAERLKLLKVLGGILRERGISFQKMDTHIKKNVRRLCILAASFSESCSRICRFLV